LIANRMRARSLIPVFVAIFFFTVLQVVMHCEARYRLPIMPFIAMLSAAGVALLLDTRRRLTFFHIKKNLEFTVLWCAGVAGVYAFTAWQFLSGKI
jgi:hypothetical protein